MLAFAYINIFYISGNLHKKLITEVICFGEGLETSRGETDEKEIFIVFIFTITKFLNHVNLLLIFKIKH